MKLKKAILAVMDRDRLRQAMDDLELDGADRRSREEMAAALGRARRALPESLLEYLSEEQVKAVCELVGVEDTGRRNLLIQRLVRRERRLRKLAAAALSGDLGDAAGMTSDGETDEVAVDNGDVFADDETELPQFADDGPPPASVRLPETPPGMMRVTKTELVWPGKYNEDGTLKEVPRVSLPFQVIERVNESRATREARKQRGASLFDIWERGEGDTFETGWRNKLIWGDNLLVMNSLLEQFAGKIDLIYIDPPFAIGADFSITSEIGDSGTEVSKAPSIIEEKVYRDTWGRGIESYLQMLADRLRLIRSLLSPTGVLYLHMGPNIASEVKLLCRQIFGASGISGDIIWKRTTTHSDSHWWGTVHDVILYYTAGKTFTHNMLYKPYAPEYIAKYYNQVDEATGRKFAADNLTAAGTRRGSSGMVWRGFDPRSKGVHWKFATETLDSLDTDGRIYWPPSGGWPRYKRFLHEMPGVVIGNLWDDVSPVNSQAAEDTGYDTQKPESLLARIIAASSNEGDLVADFFCGSGTTLSVAASLGRRWIGCDIGRFAVHSARKRLLNMQKPGPFEILNLGKYERRFWQGATFGGGDNVVAEQAIYEYLAFVLRLYAAQPVAGLQHLHGKKGRALVHVGAVDAPVTIDEISAAIDECVRVKQAELHVLGWEWEMGLAGPNNGYRKGGLMQDVAKQKGVKLMLLQIPREVMEQQAVDQGDIEFFELAYLELEIKQPKTLTAQVALNDFVIPNTELIPEDVRKKIRKWSDYIDYWAVDWDFRDDTFMQGWVAYRTRQDRTLPLTSDAHVYETPGKYRVLIKVIDIFGNDTSQAHTVEVK